MDFEKNKKLIMLAAVTAGSLLILLLLPSMQRKGGEKATSVPAPAAAWGEIDDSEKNPLLVGRETTAQQPSGDVPATSAIDILPELPAYPSPSFVTEGEDTLIYKSGIYVRIGFVPEKPAVDTIEVDGKKYVMITEDR